MVNITWHDYPSNWSNGNEVNGLADMIKYADWVTGHMLGGAIILAMGLITFFSLKSQGYSSGRSITAALIGLCILGIPLLMAGIISWGILILLSICAILAGIMFRAESNFGL